MSGRIQQLVEKFSLKACRDDLTACLSTNKLHSLDDCLVLLDLVIKQATRDAKREFEMVNTLNDYRTQHAPELPTISVEDMDALVPPLPSFTLPDVDPARDADLDKVYRIVRDVHVQLVRMIDQANDMRKRRLYLANEIYRDLENVSLV
jgi:hypothetical protein